MKNITIKTPEGAILGYVKELPEQEKKLEAALLQLYGPGRHTLCYYDKGKTYTYTDKETGKKKTVNGAPVRRIVYVAEPEVIGRGSNRLTVQQVRYTAPERYQAQPDALAGMAAQLEAIQKRLEAKEIDEEEDEGETMREAFGRIIAKPENSVLMGAVLSGDPEKIKLAFSDVSTNQPQVITQLIVDSLEVLL